MNLDVIIEVYIEELWNKNRRVIIMKDYIEGFYRYLELRIEVEFWWCWWLYYSNLLVIVKVMEVCEECVWVYGIWKLMNGGW